MLVRIGIACLALFAGTLAAQEQPAQPQSATPQPPASELPVEAKKEVIVNWTLGDQVWDFKQVSTTYEPVKGIFDPRSRTAIWTLRLVRDLRPGEAGLHANVKGSPFRPVLLDAEKIVLASDAPVELTPLEGKLGDVVRMLVQLPAADVLSQAKTVRVERRTNVGF
jgi:hypothetical protein